MNLIKTWGVQNSFATQSSQANLEEASFEEAIIKEACLENGSVELANL